MSCCFRFGPFELEPAEHSLRAAGRPVVLTHRSFDTLLYLLRNPGRLVKREELIAAVWADTVVEEGNLHWTISAVRKALAQESAESYIETVRGLGYRFVAAVEVVETVEAVETVKAAEAAEPAGAPAETDDLPAQAAPEVTPAGEKPGPPPARRWLPWLAGAAALLAGVALVAAMASKSPGPVKDAGLTSPPAPAASADPRQLVDEGQDLLRRRDAKAAAEKLKAATVADPRSAEAWHSLAQAYELLGFTRRAEEAALQALQHSGELPEAKRLAIEATHLGLARRRPEAADRLLRVYELSGRGFEEGLALAEAQRRAGLTDEARAILEELRGRSAAAREDARLALVEVDLLETIDDFPRELAAAERAVAAAREQKMGVVEARALARLASSRLSVHSLAACSQALGELAAARRQAAALDDRLLLAGILLELGNARSDCEGPAAAEQSYLESVDIFREAGALGRLPPLLYNLGDVRLDEGDLLGADRFMREALETCQQHATLCRERFLHQLGVNRLHRGELAEARRLLEEGIRLNQQIGNRFRVAEAQSYLPDLAAASGDPSQAIELSRQVLQMRQEIGTVAGIAWAQADLSIWLTEAGRGEEAAELARQAVAAVEEVGEKPFEGVARASLAAASLESGDLAVAERESARAIAVLYPPNRPFSSFFIWRIRAEVLLARGQADAAEVLIEGGIEHARRGGFVTYELEGRLLKARLAHLRKNDAEARRLAGELAIEARSKGFGLIAHRCEALISGTERIAPL
jgi:DNA-binding winged helix-turn-helix (wHTH) protein